MSLSDPAAAEPLRIAAVPAGHPYARNLLDPGPAAGERIVLLPDPLPAGASAGQWWPPVMLDPAWIRANADRFDVLHLHFGTESFSVAHLQQVLDALRAVERPLVYTVHDITNPQLADQAQHRAQLDLLVAAADEVITLTEGAAAEIRARWGRDAVVIAHPMLAEPPASLAAPASTEVFAPEAVLSRTAERAPDARADVRAEPPALTIGLHLRDLRPNIDALGTLDTLLAAVSLLRVAALDVNVVVDLRDRVRDEAVRHELRLRTAALPGVELREHPRPNDADLAADLAGIDIEVLPYRHGTHSGWLELCWDLGLAVAAPAVGFFDGQHPHRGEVASFRPGSAESLAAALLELAEPLEAASRAARRATLVRDRAAWRITQQRDIHRAHLAVYRRALSAVTV